MVLVPAQGFGSIGLSDITLDGKQMSEDVTRAVQDITVNRTIVGASTVVMTLLDSDRSILRSGIFDHRVRMTLDGLDFILTKPTKATDTLPLTFEDAAIHAMRQVSGHVTAAKGTTTRSQFAERLVAQVPGVSIVAYPDPNKTREPLSRGTSGNKNENTWQCLTRLANEVKWRCFVVGWTVYFGPDSWLMSFPVLATLVEFENGVDNIDFDYDEGKPLTSITVTCRTDGWGWPPGQPVALDKMGIASGTYLIETLNRPSMFLSTATVSLTAPQKALPEPSSATTSVTGSKILDSGTTKAPNSKAGIIVSAAKSQLGVPYQWGGESPGHDFDCSGLTQWCCAQAGISVPHNANLQYEQGPKVGAGKLYPGDLVFFVGSDGTSTHPGHVGIYIGNGKMIDAPYTGVDVRVDDISDVGGYIGATRPAS